MPNYSLIVNPKFTPMTLEQQISPLVAYREMWDNQNKEISNLQKSATEASLLLGPNDEEEKEAYEAYKKAIDTAADRLNKVGYDAESERILRDARNVFARDITPIVIASKKREEEINNQNTTLANNPYAKFAMPASSVSLSTYREDPTFTANKYFVDATKARGAVETMATEVAKQIIAKKGKYYDVLEKIPGVAFKLNMLRHKGFTPQDLLGDNEILDFIVNQAVDPINANIDAWDRIDDATKENTKNWLKDVAKQGLTKSIGDQLVEPVTDEYGMQSALQNQRFQHEINMLGLQNPPSSPSIPGRFINIGITEEDPEYAEKHNEFLKAYGDPNSPTISLSSKYTTSPFTKRSENPLIVYQQYKQIQQGAAAVYKALKENEVKEVSKRRSFEDIIFNTNSLQGKIGVQKYLWNSFKHDLNKRWITAEDFYNTVVKKVAQRRNSFSLKDEDAIWLAKNGIDTSASLKDINDFLGGGNSPYSRKKQLPYEVQSGTTSAGYINDEFMRTLSIIENNHPDAVEKSIFKKGNARVWVIEEGKLKEAYIKDVRDKLKNNTHMNIVLYPELFKDKYGGNKIGFNSTNGLFFINVSDLGTKVQQLVNQCKKDLKGYTNEEDIENILSTYSYAIEEAITEHTQTTGSTNKNA